MNEELFNKKGSILKKSKIKSSINERLRGYRIEIISAVNLFLERVYHGS